MVKTNSIARSVGRAIAWAVATKRTDSATPQPADPGSDRLLEDGSHRLLESADKRLLENG